MTAPAVGQIWLDRNFAKGRFVRIEHVVGDGGLVHVRTVIKNGDHWLDKPRSKLSYVIGHRFTGKAGGYAFHEAADGGNHVMSRVETPWGISYQTAEINGYEAHLLLFLLDDYITRVDLDQTGAGSQISVFGNTNDLASLRDRLFLAHEHPDGEED